VLELVVPVLCAAPVPLALPLVLLPVDVLFPAEVFEVVGVLFVVEGEAELEDEDSAEPVEVPKSVLGGRESVIVTGM
jgi:hypothetical protein